MKDDGIITCALVTDLQLVCSFIGTTIIHVHGGVVNGDTYIDTFVIHSFTDVGCTTIETNGKMFDINS